MLLISEVKYIWTKAQRTQDKLRFNFYNCLMGLCDLFVVTSLMMLQSEALFC